MSDNITGTWVTFERTFKQAPTTDELHELTIGLPSTAKVRFEDLPGFLGLGTAVHVTVRYLIADGRITAAPEPADEARP
ncbi:hypothetical protein TPB0596_12170 [Tsukamurella pulmonis]|uniref:hypothetical protein n=1 Tax=Tsukamurella pulmonis TaxID=47312 RepID=UPI001EE03D1E|nr:hypothetical protein [Tsukamurella pulmonis]BDD81454.1 hypothetical protein TPB0596_12170 [Tsukamurella pulmonis]